MDILSKRAMEITTLALNGLSARHKTITSNIANANTPDYSRASVEFEGQLERILQAEEAKEQNKEIENTVEYSGFRPRIIISSEGNEGNNVNVEMEMAELAKNGMKYNALAALQAKAFKGLSEVIMGTK